MMHAVVIHPEGDAFIVGHPDDESQQYDNARAALKCRLIERVRIDLDGSRLDIWVDEEGLWNQLLYNVSASRLAFGDSLDAILVGTAYVTGPDLEPLTLEQAEAVMRRIGD